MFLRRSALAIARRGAFRPVAARPFSSSITRFEAKKSNDSTSVKKFEDVSSLDDLIPAGAPEGTVPTDLDQATGLERFEILGKMQGVDVFDMKPLDSSRKGTLDNPIVVKSYGDEQYLGCTGYPADTHNVIWLTCSRDRPVERCPECGGVYKMEYVGPQDSHDHHHDHHADSDGAHNYDGEPKTFADFVRPEYR
ncbi:subunit IV of cytochrome c oxidase [Delphinella strobiligena]|nr:subunit IV of cytochrome c oxidase [Delphinella strobiligena]